MVVAVALETTHLFSPESAPTLGLVVSIMTATVHTMVAIRPAWTTKIFKMSFAGGIPKTSLFMYKKWGWMNLSLAIYWMTLFLNLKTADYAPLLSTIHWSLGWAWCARLGHNVGSRLNGDYAANQVSPTACNVFLALHLIVVLGNLL